VVMWWSVRVWWDEVLGCVAEVRSRMSTCLHWSTLRRAVANAVANGPRWMS
jgi:hypothetical protein